MPQETARLDVLDRAECLTLLASAPIGRIAFSHQALPALQPVNFVVDDESVVIRTNSSSKLAAAARNAVVAFEADEFDPETRSGWSVTVTGHARVVTDRAECERLTRLPLEPWVPGVQDHFIRIRAEFISGRRITRVADLIAGREAG